MRCLLLFIAFAATATLHAQEIIGQERWPDGTLRATRYSEGGRIHFITYHENGRVKEIGCFHNGRRDGAWKQYSDTGVLLAHAGFRNGQRQGVWQFRDEDDRPMGALTYDAGALARAEQFDPAGALLGWRMY